jgi:hypothetical protein
LKAPLALKGTIMEKSHIWGAFTILVLWESCIKTRPTYNFFYSSLQDAAGSQTSN